MGEAPNATLKLRWAHGFRAYDTQRNLKYTRTGSEIVFTTAGLGVVQDSKKKTQRFFDLHKEDVVSLALHPNGDIVATGQMAGKELSEKSTIKMN
jgi:hypothetical protein